MATIDEVKRAGGRAANFLDIGGGAKAELVRNSLEIVLKDPKVKSVFFKCSAVSRAAMRWQRDSGRVRDHAPEPSHGDPVAGTEAAAGRRLLEAPR